MFVKPRSFSSRLGALFTSQMGEDPSIGRWRIRRPPVERLVRRGRRLETTGGPYSHEALTDRGPLLNAKTWACQLQGHGDREIDLDDIKMCEADAVIIDYSRDGSGARAFSSTDVAAMKIRRSGAPKQIIAYLSIGEAEEARFYWHKPWARKNVKTDNAPRWLYKANEGGWTGNWRVKFWDPDWQKIIVDDANSFLNQIIDAAFDGVFLDIVEAAEYWEDSERGADRRANASKEMLAFVAHIAAHARNRRGKREFLVIPNGDFLVEVPQYRAVISALMREDILYKQANRADEPPRLEPRAQEGEDGVAEIAARLNLAAPDNLPVLAIDYLVDRPEDRVRIPQAAVTLRNLAPNVLPYFSVRNLDRLCPEYREEAVA